MLATSSFAYPSVMAATVPYPPREVRYFPTARNIAALSVGYIHPASITVSMCL